MLANVNYLAVLLSAIVMMLVGFVWYHPKVLGDTWMRLIGKSSVELGNPKSGYALTFVAALVLSWTLAEVLKFSAATTLPGALKMAFIVWLGFVASTSLTNAIFAGKKRNLYLLEQGHHLVSMLAAAVVLTWLP